MLLAASFMLLAAGPPAPVSGAVGLPPEIERHYAEYDLVNAFSTPRERYRISEEAPSSDPRLARLAALMDRLQERIDDVDPAMAGGGGTKWRESVYRSDLVQVVAWRTDRSGQEGGATLDVSALGPSDNVTLVGQYDALAGEDRIPSVARLLGVAATPNVHTREVHHWRRVDGQWRRDGATVHFLSN